MEQEKEHVSPMSNGGRNAYVVSRITEAMLSLLEEKSLEEISVSELCARAEVGRSSFYRNFQVKEDVLRRRIGEIFTGCRLEGSGDRPLHEVLLAVFTCLEGHRDFCTLLQKRGLVHLMKDVILDLCGLRTGQSREEAYAAAFAAYGLYGWVETWIQRGMVESAQEIADMFQAAGL